MSQHLEEEVAIPHLSEIPVLRFATWRPRGLSKSVRGRVIIGGTPFRVLITLLVTYVLSLLGL